MMERQTFANVWDALEDTQTEAASMTMRSNSAHRGRTAGAPLERHADGGRPQAGGDPAPIERSPARADPELQPRGARRSRNESRTERATEHRGLTLLLPVRKRGVTVVYSIARALAPGPPHHVTQRVFFEQGDYALYRDWLGESCPRFGFEAGPMPDAEPGSSHPHAGRRRIGAGAGGRRLYAGFVNARVRQTGHLFPSRFGSSSASLASLAGARIRRLDVLKLSYANENARPSCCKSEAFARGGSAAHRGATRSVRR